jgi:predicted alpha-1,6-mannanase (GH76 family)
LPGDLTNTPISYSYNQGVVLGGLVELNKASPNQSYIDSANTIAQAAIKLMADSNNVIHDTCEDEGGCFPNATQFKGVFIRNLLLLHQASPNDLYATVIKACAQSTWDNNRDTSTNELSINWAGPFVSPTNSSAHSSAMEPLIAAIYL